MQTEKFLDAVWEWRFVTHFVLSFSILFSGPGARAPSGPGFLHYRDFTILLRHTRLGRTPLDEESARHKDLYLTTHTIHKGQTSMHPAGFKPTISISEMPQTHACKRRRHCDRLHTDLGIVNYLHLVPKLRMSGAIPHSPYVLMIYKVINLHFIFLYFNLFDIESRYLECVIRL
jgi:hypothetical protein